MSIAIFLAAMAGAPVVATPQSAGDWEWGCDNFALCEAVVLMPEGESPGTTMVATLSRPAGPPSQLTIDFDAPDGSETLPSGWRLAVDGRPINATGAQTKGTAITLSAPATRAAEPALVRGHWLTLADAKGIEVARLSLRGAAAALASMRRPRMRNALSAVPVKPSGTTAVPDTGAIVAFAEASRCADERQGLIEDTVWPLAGDGMTKGDRALVLISCGSGAYNFSSAPFIASRPRESASWRFDPARFDFDPDWTRGEARDDYLVNASFEPEAGMLNSFSKGRGLGDCGTSLQYAWDGTSFRLTEAYRSDECRGSRHWIKLWQRAAQPAH